MGTIIGALLITRFVVQFIGQTAALVWLRRHRPDLDRPFRMWTYAPLPHRLRRLGFRLHKRPFGGCLELTF